MSEGRDQISWYLVQTHPHAEARAAEHLQRQGFSTYLPRHLKHRRHARKSEMVVAPVFPRYLFVAIDKTSQRWLNIRSTFGVARMVGASDGPARVPESVISELREREDAHGYITLDQQRAFIAGERVQITDGAFSLCSALYEFMSDNDRVAVLLDLMGRRVRVFVDRMAIAAA